MSSPPLRSSRPASVASSFLQSGSPRLPSPLNPSPNAFSPSVQSNTPRNSPVGDTLEPLYSIMEGDGLELTIPQPTDPQPLNIPRPRTTSFSRSALYTQVQMQVNACNPISYTDVSPVSGSIPYSRYQVQPTRTYGRHPSPSSSPYVQGIPFPTSPPLPSSPLAGVSRSSPLMTHSPPMVEGSCLLSPPSSRQDSPVPIYNTCSEFQSSSFRSPPQPSQSYFQPAQASLSQISPISPPSAPSSSFRSSRQCLIQQSFANAYEAHGNPHGISSLQDDVQNTSPLFGARPQMSPRGSPPESRRSSVNMPQHISYVNSNMPTLYEAPASYRRATGCGPGAFRDEEIRASFDEAVGQMETCAPSLPYALGGVGYEADGFSIRAVPMSIGSISRIRGSILKGQMQGEGHSEMESGGLPVESGFAASIMAHGDLHRVRSRASSIRSQGSAFGAHAAGFVHESDGVTSGQVVSKGQEIPHGIEQTRERGHGRRVSNASIRSTSSRGSRMSGPAQSPSQVMMMSSQSQTQTFSSLSSFGIGLEEAEREERRSKTFFRRKRAGSAADARKDDRLSPRTKDGVMSGEQGDLVSSNSDHAADADDAGSSQSPKGTAKHGSLIFGSKNTAVADQQDEGYQRAEKYVSMAVTSILSPSTIRALSPLGDVLIKAANTATFVGHEAAPLVKDALSVSSSLLSFVPIPGLEEAAKALLNVWDACKKVDTNRLACLRLVERCATLLYAVRREISEAGEDVANDLASPLAQLCTALNSVRSFLETQMHRPFLARYVRREEITRDLAGCNQVITDASERFGISVQIRTLKELYAAEHESRRFVEEALQKMCMENQKLQMHFWERVQTQGLQGFVPAGLPAGNALGLTTEDVSMNMVQSTGPGYGQLPTMGSLTRIGCGNGPLPNTPTTLTCNLPAGMDHTASPTPTRTTFSSTDTATKETETTTALSHTIADLHRVQDSKDADADVAALRGRLADAIENENDAELLRRLQIGEGEIPEVVMTFGRVLGMHAPARTEFDGEEHVMGQVDCFDRKIMERGIDAMTRLTNGGAEGTVAWDLPHWTITRYEVSQTRQIGTGFFADVYLGDWQGRMVVIKALKPNIPQELFVRDINVWHSLDHPNVLPLYGASSAQGGRPWFLVSKFCGGGSLLDWLRERTGAAEANEVCVDLLKCIHEIAKGMEYLHTHGVLHGNLKAANVLVDESGQCVISDFGQYEMKSQAYQLGGQAIPLDKPQWKAPELLMGDSRPTPAGDVYAFATCCIEILGMRDFSTGEMDKGLFVTSVLAKDVRLTLSRFSGYSEVVGAIERLLHSCCARDPALRPSFAQLVCSLEDIRGLKGPEGRGQSPHTVPIDRVSSCPPNLVAIPSVPPPLVDTGSAPSTSNESSPADEHYETASEGLIVDVQRISVAISESAGSEVSTTAIHTISNQHSEISRVSSSYTRDRDRDGAADNEQHWGARCEEDYRVIAGMNHAFHDSLTLPLWSPTHVKLGAVGYLDKSTGEFITLFNAFEPPQCSKVDLSHLPSFNGYGKLATFSREGGKRNVAQRSLSALSGFLTFKARGERSFPERIARQYSFPLEKGKTAAHLCVERTLHRFIEDLDIPKTWFKLQVEEILKIFGPRHGIEKEDLLVVVGALDALDYALFVSDAHPDGRARFNVFSDRKKGEPWGMFATERAAQNGGAGSLTSQSRWVEVDENVQAMFTSKVSTVRATDASAPLPGADMDTVLLAGLSFELGQQEPTLM